MQQGATNIYGTYGIKGGLQHRRYCRSPRASREASNQLYSTYNTTTQKKERKKEEWK
jgi:hypothetical protein